MINLRGVGERVGMAFIRFCKWSVDDESVRESEKAFGEVGKEHIHIFWGCLLVGSAASYYGAYGIMILCWFLAVGVMIPGLGMLFYHQEVED